MAVLAPPPLSIRTHLVQSIPKAIYEIAKIMQYTYVIALQFKLIFR